METVHAMQFQYLFPNSNVLVAISNNMYQNLVYQIRLVLDWGRGLLSNTGYPV